MIRHPWGVVTGTLRLLWQLTAGTVGICFRYRVTGLAAEAAFFALVSLPPLALSVVAGFGIVARALPPDTLDRITANIIEGAGTFLQPDTVDDVVRPLLDGVVVQAALPITLASLALMLWAGSRWLNVYVDTITIMYGLDGQRHFLKTRALSFVLYLVLMLVLLVLLPLLVLGPELLASIATPAEDVVRGLYWPVVIVVSIVFLTTLYHVAVPVRTAWRRDLPGAGIALLLWVLGSVLLRMYLRVAFGSSSAYGSLGAPIALLFWLYLTALAVLVGAALNAVIDRRWPRGGGTGDARARQAQAKKNMTAAGGAPTVEP